MSDTLNTPQDPSGLNLPDDFGQAIAAEFEKRAQDSAQNNQPEGGGDGAEPASTTPGPTIEDDLSATTADAPAEEIEEVETPAEDAPAADPSTEDAVEPAADAPEVELPDPAEAPEASPADDATSTTTSAGYLWSEGDQSHQFTDEEVRQGLILNQWAAGIPDDMKAAFAAVEQGQGIVVSRADYESFQAWKHGQQTRTEDEQLADQYGFDDEQLAYVRQLREQGQQPQQYAQGQPNQAPAQDQDFSQLHQNVDAAAAIMEEGIATYQESRGLTDEQAAALVNHAVQAGVIPSFAETLAQRNPVTGQVISAPDPREVIQKAMDYALIQNPEMHSQVLARTGPPTPTPATPEAAAAAAERQAQADSALRAKKASAASVASAPAAAVTPAPRDLNAMSQQQKVDALTADLTKAMSQG